MQVTPTVKMASSLRDVSEQESFNRASRSQKKWGMLWSAQKDSRVRRRVWHRHWHRRESRTQLLEGTAPVPWRCCGRRDGRWPHTDHRPSRWAGNHPDQSKRGRNTSVLCTLHRGWIDPECACLSAFVMVTDEKGDVSEGQVAEEEVHGVWRWASSLMSRMMSRLPRTVVRYMPRNRAKNMPCCSGQTGSPRRRNSDTLAIFLPLHAPLLSAVNKRIVKAAHFHYRGRK